MGQIREFENRRRTYPRMPLVLGLLYRMDQKKWPFATFWGFSLCLTILYLFKKFV